MPNWRQLARARLGGLSLDPDREDEIVTELAHHLEDLYEDWCQRGVAAEEATARALDAVPDWAELRREIQYAEQGDDAMNQRTRNLWLPGMVTLAFSWGLLRLFYWAGLRPRIIWMDEHAFLWFSLPWLLVLPTIGALGAYWSRRVGGRPWERLLAGAFPAVVWTVLFIAFFPVAVLVDSHVSLVRQLSTLASFLLSSCVVPGAALLAGTLAFLKDHPREPARFAA